MGRMSQKEKHHGDFHVCCSPAGVNMASHCPLVGFGGLPSFAETSGQDTILTLPKSLKGAHYTSWLLL